PAGGAHERLALPVLFLSRRLADNEERRVPAPDAEHRLRASPMKRTPGAVAHLRLERAPRVGVVGRIGRDDADGPLRRALRGAGGRLRAALRRAEVRFRRIRRGGRQRVAGARPARRRGARVPAGRAAQREERDAHLGEVPDAARAHWATLSGRTRRRRSSHITGPDDAYTTNSANTTSSGSIAITMITSGISSSLPNLTFCPGPMSLKLR